jgi:1D-myo-inositol-tetrakisphosphate 5-kinase/inositol-polyphosphate multikinase
MSCYYTRMCTLHERSLYSDIQNSHWKTAVDEQAQILSKHEDTIQNQLDPPSKSVTQSNMATSAAEQSLDPSTLKSYSNAAAGHDGVLSDESGEMVVKPCVQAEIDFYQKTVDEHPDFAELMPTFLGTLSLGAPEQVTDEQVAQLGGDPAAEQEQKDKRLHGAKIATESAIVLENLTFGFKQPNVLDLKLGARLYADGTSEEKAARLDKVASETTSGSLNFRIAGMKVWNGREFETYDKFYGRKFNADSVHDGFETFFASLFTPGVKKEDAAELLETILAEITKARHILERTESRMYSASVLIVYEGDGEALASIMSADEKKPRMEEKAPTTLELQKSEEEEEEEEEEGPPPAFNVKLIDFAHAQWTPGKGQDENMIKGLKSIEDQMDALIAKLD